MRSAPSTWATAAAARPSSASPSPRTPLNGVFGLLVPALIVGIVRYGSSGLIVIAWYAAATVIALLLAYAGPRLGRRSGAVIICC
jgi:hypothetical protein